MATTTERAACPACETEQPVNQDGRIRKHGRPACLGSYTPIGTARIPKRSDAGFYRDPETDVRLRSVTTILNQGSPKEALIHWAGNLVAETAMEHLPALVRASRRPESRKDAYDWLRRAHTRKRDERAEIGSAVHSVIESKVLGTPIPRDVLDDDELRPFVVAFEAFVRDWQVEFTASEMVVANYEDEYAGTLDFTLKSALIAAHPLIAAPPDVELMGDTKTGGELDETTYKGDVKGVYPEAGMQMSAYRRARYGWLKDGTKVERPPTHSVGVVLHLRPEGYRLYPVRCGDAEYAAFLHARGTADWQTGPARTVVGDALTLPSTRKAA
ncbi:MAG: hypothetical protein ACRDT8_00130 [Micromonosporaceae bacterium]